MNKELTPLEALEAFRQYVSDFYDVRCFEKIENALKALEIIKKKEVDVHLLLTLIRYHKENALREYNKHILNDYCDLYILTQEEYNLLKEVLL